MFIKVRSHDYNIVNEKLIWCLKYMHLIEKITSRGFNFYKTSMIAVLTNKGQVIFLNIFAKKKSLNGKV